MTPTPAAFLLVLLAAAASLSLACAPDAPAPEVATSEAVPEKGIAWIREHAVPLATSDPRGDQQDLAPLKAMIGNARIVALGEATHGTSEFFRMKHRLVELLVREMGFDHFILEATWAETTLIDDYVQGGPGNPEEILANLGYWPWNTREMLDMILWIRAYNQQQRTGKPIRFLGMDMQDPRGAMGQVAGYLRTVDETRAVAAQRSYRCLDIAGDQRDLNEIYQRYPTLSPGEQNECRQGVEEVHSWFLRHAPGGEDEKDFVRALGSARMLVQFESLLRHRSLRDRFMAENVTWLLDRAGPGSKAVIWSHNGHVNRLPGLLGGILKKRFGDEALLVGLTFHRGTFNAFRQDADGRFGGLETFHAAAPPENTLEHALDKAGRPRMILDLRRSSSGTTPAWLQKPLRMRRIGASYQPSRPESGYTLTRLGKEYDLLIFFEQTRASSPLRSGMATS